MDTVYYCAECGQPFTYAEGEVTQHLTPDGDIDYDQDADHVAYEYPNETVE